MDSSAFSFFRVGRTLWFALLLASSLGWAAETLKPPLTENGILAPVAATSGPANDFHIVLRSHSNDTDDERKYLTNGWNGWNGGVVRWRYNDANRPPSLVANASTAIDRIQAAMRELLHTVKPDASVAEAAR